MIDDAFAEYLIESAEAIDRKLSPARIKSLKHSHDFFIEAGMSEEAVKQVMGLTSHHIRLIRAVKDS